MAGIINEPIDATVAGPDPEIAEKNMQATTVTMANPPTTNPINASAKLSSLLEIPPLPISNPAKINKGIAISGKESNAVNAFCTYVVNGMLSLKKTTTNSVDKPIEMPIGTLRNINKINDPKSAKVVIAD